MGRFLTWQVFVVRESLRARSLHCVHVSNGPQLSSPSSTHTGSTFTSCCTAYTLIFGLVLIFSCAHIGTQDWMPGSVAGTLVN